MSIRGGISEGGGGAGSWDSGTDTSSAMGITLDVSVLGSPGEVRVSGDVSGKMPISGRRAFAQLQGEDIDSNISIRFIPGENNQETLREYADTIERRFNFVRGNSNVIESAIPSLPSPPSPDIVTDPTSVDGNIWYGLFGQKLGGESPVEFAQEANFTPMKVPVTQDYTIDGLNLPSIPITVRVTVKEAFNKFAAENISQVNYPEVTLDVPPEAFVEPVQVGSEQCLDEFPNIDDSISDARQEVDLAERNLGDAEDIITSASQTMRDEVGVSDIFSIDESDISISDLSGLSRSDVRRMLSRVSGTKEDLDDVRDANNLVNQVSNQISSISDSQCVTVFQSELAPIQSTIDDLVTGMRFLSDRREKLISIFESLGLVKCSDEYSGIDSNISSLEQKVRNIEEISSTEEITSLTSTLESLRSTVDNQVTQDSPCLDEFNSRLDNIKSTIESLGKSIGCSDVPRRIRNRVSGYESEVQEFTERTKSRISPERHDELVNEAGTILNIINSEVDDENPCKGSLRSRVRSARSRLNSFWEGVEGQLRCSQQFSQINAAIQDLRNRVATTNPVTDPQRASSLAEEAQRLSNRVSQNVDNERCRRRFRQSISSTVDNLDVSIDRVRTVKTGEIGETERMQEFEELKSAIEGTLADIDIEEP